MGCHHSQVLYMRRRILGNKGCNLCAFVVFSFLNETKKVGACYYVTLNL